MVRLDWPASAEFGLANHRCVATLSTLVLEPVFTTI